MKPITALFLLSLAAAGTACSDTAAKTETDTAAAEATIESADAGAEVKGSLNLNIGKAPEGPGRQIVGSTSSSAGGGLIVAPGTSGGNFEDVPGLGIMLEDETDALAEPVAPAEPSDEDEIVRLPD